MRLLVHVDGSPWASLALQHSARRLEPGDEIVLLAVCPRDSEGYLECGRMVLEAAQRACAGVLAELKVRTRLAVGDAGMVVPALAAEERADLVVMGPPDTNEAGTHARGYLFPRERDTVTRSIERLAPGDLRQAMSSRCECPILTGSPRGIELLVGNEAVLVSTRREAALSSMKDGFEGPRLRPGGLGVRCAAASSAGG
jgi:Universal stress protein family